MNGFPCHYNCSYCGGIYKNPVLKWSTEKPLQLIDANKLIDIGRGWDGLQIDTTRWLAKCLRGDDSFNLPWISLGELHSTPLHSFLTWQFASLCLVSLLLVPVRSKEASTEIIQLYYVLVWMESKQGLSLHWMIVFANLGKCWNTIRLWSINRMGWRCILWVREW